MNFFSSKTHISTSFVHDIYGLLFTINQLKESFLLATTRKMEQKLRKTKKHEKRK